MVDGVSQGDVANVVPSLDGKLLSYMCPAFGDALAGSSPSGTIVVAHIDTAVVSDTAVRTTVSWQHLHGAASLTQMCKLGDTMFFSGDMISVLHGSTRIPLTRSVAWDIGYRLPRCCALDGIK